MLKLGSIVYAMAACACCLAQEPASPTATAADLPQAAVAATPPSAGDCCLIVDGTPVTLEILDLLNSAALKRGDKFRIRLATPVLVDDPIMLAAGLEGVGEVVHAERSRSGGKAGELLLAARYLDHEGRQLRLRGLKLGGSGKDNAGAALATSLVVGPFALFVRGGEIEVPAGTLVQARIADDTTLPLARQSPVDPATPDSSTHTDFSTHTESGHPPAAVMAEAATPQQPSVETIQQPKE
ncbi:MAG: hypothetical protein EOP91_08375 [Lysobacteraceae bacterium]|nr:MAG: hypothetical protein EOP91_08375 [Xanthomonadaceae bacterium]